MVLRRDKKLETGRPQRKSTEPANVAREHIRRQQSVTPAPLDDTQLTSKPPESPNEADGYEQLMKALGTTDRDFVKGLMGQLLTASARGADRVDRDWLFFTLGLLKNHSTRRGWIRR